MGPGAGHLDGLRAARAALAAVADEPGDTDPSADGLARHVEALDELARCVALIADAASAITARPDGDQRIARASTELARAIVARRDALTCRSTEAPAAAATRRNPPATNGGLERLLDLTGAFQEAQRLGQRIVGTEHLLVATFADPSIRRLTREAGTDLRDVQACIAASSDDSPPEHWAVRGTMSITKDAADVVTAAAHDSGLRDDVPADSGARSSLLGHLFVRLLTTSRPPMCADLLGDLHDRRPDLVAELTGDRRR